MKKQMLVLSIVILMLVTLISGCTENDTNDNTGSSTPKTYTWTAKEFQNDLDWDTDWVTYIKMDYNTLEEGDTLIIQDTISEVSYDLTSDRTTITFAWVEGTGNLSLNLPFEGDLSGTYQTGDEVKITGTMKHVEFTYTNETLGLSMDYEVELFEEQWTTQEEFITLGGGSLPATSIEKVE